MAEIARIALQNSMGTGTKPPQVAVVGLGYVGLLLSFQFARSGVAVLGLDIDTAKVDALNQGRSYIKHITSETVAEALRSGAFSATSDFARIREVRAIIICVPTPLNKNRELRRCAAVEQRGGQNQEKRSGT